jgi:hypothetical protein
MLWAHTGFSQVQIRDSTYNADMKLYLVGLGEDTRVIIMPICKKKLPGILFVHVHEDESTAADAAFEFIDSTGLGCFVTLKHGMGRNISFNIKGKTYKFDPNRIYTAEGRKATLEKFGAYSDSAFAAVSALSNFLTSNYIDSNLLIVALHNNTNDGGLTLFLHLIPLTIYPSNQFSSPSPTPFYNPFYLFLPILCLLSIPILNHMYSHPYVAILSLVLSLYS